MAVILVGPPLLNYATMMRERQLLKPENHTLYDIGFGQKMYMSCKGHGKWLRSFQNMHALDRVSSLLRVSTASINSLGQTFCVD